MKQDVMVNRSYRLSWRDWGGATLLLLGVLFVAINLAGKEWLENWWSLFILIPALLFLGLGWAGRSKDGRFPFSARFSLGIGLVVLTVAGMFLLNLNWSVWWPLMIATPGVALFMLGSSGGNGRFATPGLISMGRWFGASMILLGLTFLLDQLASINLHTLFGDFHWWGFFILLPGLGAFWEAFRVLRHNGSPLTVTWLMILGVWILSSAAQELLGATWVSWEGLVGIGLVGSGAILLLGQMHR